MSLHKNFNQQFYDNSSWIKLFIPLSYLYQLIISTKSLLYALKIFTSKKLPVPVIVVGNITLGGTGKTPLLIAIAKYLKNTGHKPGIISRGYKGREGKSREVLAQSRFQDVGDEPFMLKRCLGIPIFVGKKRVESANLMLRLYPDIDVILSDDGLQHLELSRDYEIIVVDKLRGFGNNYLLPAGPLRESKDRLSSVNAVVMNGQKEKEKHTFGMHYEANSTIKSIHTDKTIEIKNLKNIEIFAATGIGNPERFYFLLTKLGITYNPLIFDDHYEFKDSDFYKCGNQIILMTEKDAVRCLDLKNKNLWYLSIDAIVDTKLYSDITKKLGL